MQPETPEKLMGCLIDISSRSSRAKNMEAFVREFRNQHRTHQQSIGSSMFTVIKELAALYDNASTRTQCFDGRNEFLGKMCSEINESMTAKFHSSWDGLPYI